MQRNPRNSSSVPVDWNPENMGKAYVWSDVWTYITSWRHASFITREERVKQAGVQSPGPTRNSGLCRADSTHSRAMESPHGNGESRLYFVWLASTGPQHGLWTGDSRPNPTDGSLNSRRFHHVASLCFVSRFCRSKHQIRYISLLSYSAFPELLQNYPTRWRKT
jgi:hypothetical protein